MLLSPKVGSIFPSLERGLECVCVWCVWVGVSEIPEIRLQKTFDLALYVVPCTLGTASFHLVKTVLWWGPSGKEPRPAPNNQHWFARCVSTSPWSWILQPQPSFQMLRSCWHHGCHLWETQPRTTRWATLGFSPTESMWTITLWGKLTVPPPLFF